MRLLWAYILMCTLYVMTAHAQGRPDVAPEGTILPPIELTPMQVSQISDEMSGYITELLSLSEAIATSDASQIKILQRQVEAIDVRWTAYTQIEQVDIGSSPILMDLLSQYKMTLMAVNDSINSQNTRLSALGEFMKAQAFITQCIGKYSEMSSHAMQYSLIPQTAKLLADVKAQEAMLMQRVEENYQKAVAAAAVSAEAKGKLPALEQKYISIKASSEKIQACVYKTWLERIKDYVLTFAGVAILLVAINFFVVRLKAMKQARDMAKKYGNILKPNDDIPTI